jgi:hypothetical protein
VGLVATDDWVPGETPSIADFAASHNGAAGAPITATGLTVGKSYTCTVKAKNARGLGLASGKSNALNA